jgi:hypothetical protein
VLKRAANVRLVYEPGLMFRGRVTLHVGRTAYSMPKMARDEWDTAEARQQSQPNLVSALSGRNLWLFRGKFCWADDGLNESEIHALLTVRGQCQRQRVERAQAIAAMGSQPQHVIRRAIPDDLKQLVWLRDSGRCCRCGSRTELQFDHIIPISMSGATVAEKLAGLVRLMQPPQGSWPDRQVRPSQRMAQAEERSSGISCDGWAACL